MLAICIANSKCAQNLVTKQRAEHAVGQRAKCQGHSARWGEVGREADAEMLFTAYLLLQDLKVL